jgi:deoxyribodipyrimidine photolyase
MAIGPWPSVVWFKRDLRIGDHAQLVEAVSRGPRHPVAGHRARTLESKR